MCNNIKLTYFCGEIACWPDHELRIQGKLSSVKSGKLNERTFESCEKLTTFELCTPRHSLCTQWIETADEIRRYVFERTLKSQLPTEARTADGRNHEHTRGSHYATHLDSYAVCRQRPGSTLLLGCYLEPANSLQNYKQTSNGPKSVVTLLSLSPKEPFALEQFQCFRSLSSEGMFGELQSPHWVELKGCKRPTLIPLDHASRKDRISLRDWASRKDRASLRDRELDRSLPDMKIFFVTYSRASHLETLTTDASWEV